MNYNTFNFIRNTRVYAFLRPKESKNKIPRWLAILLTPIIYLILVIVVLTAIVLIMYLFIEGIKWLFESYQEAQETYSNTYN